MRRLSLIASGAGLAFVIAACVPSPTATPPRATPFPTLVLPTDTPPQTSAPTAASLQVAAPTATPFPIKTSTAILARPAEGAATPIRRGSMPPVVQVLASTWYSRISVDQPVDLSVFAADELGLARVELYDENQLFGVVSVPGAPARTWSTVVTWKSERLGLHHLRVIAYDLSGYASVPAELSFNVINDNRRPAAFFTDPFGPLDAPVGAPFVVQGAAVDEVGVTRLDLYVDYTLYTYITSDQPNGQTPLSAAFTWIPESTGVHKLFLRAHDNDDDTGDSGLLVVNAISTEAPRVSASFEASDVDANAILLVHALAVSANGIARVELWADDQVVEVLNSSAPDGQTSFDAELAWPAGAVGDHTLSVRAYDRAGLNGSIEVQTIHVHPASGALPSRTPPTPTPTAPPTPIPATPTPKEVLPAGPTITVTTGQEGGGLELPGLLNIRMLMHGTVELGRVELWASYAGETTPRFLFGDSVKGATDKTLDFDWAPPRAGVVFLFARVIDQGGQVGQSPLVVVHLNSPAAPTATPAFFQVSGRWQAVIPTNRFDILFVQIGRAVRGSFSNLPLNGDKPFTGSIVAGTITRDSLQFGVEFDSADATPSTLSFQCVPDNPITKLTCNYEDEAGNRGSAVFSPQP